jgi:hypothetical protein
MKTADFEYDVAISFLSRDINVALQIADLLKGQLRTFVYPREQEAAAATDGLTAFREVFRDNARVSVVLMRAGWGETPWTGVEEVAIRDRCLANKFKNLVVVQLERCDLPSWIPESYVSFDLQLYAIQEIVGIVKGKATELHADLRVPTSADRAEALQRRRDFDRETRTLLENSNRPFIHSYGDLKREIQQRLVQIEQRTGWSFVCGEPGAVIGGFICSAEGRTIQLVTESVYVNTAREGKLRVREYGIAIPLQEASRMFMPFSKLEPLSRATLQLRRTPELGWCWEHSQGHLRPSPQMAEIILGWLIDGIAQDSRNRV